MSHKPWQFSDSLDQLIRDVKRGVQSRIQELERTVDVGNYSITVLDAVLANFLPDCIWPNDVGLNNSNANNVKASSAAIRCLANCLGILGRLPVGDIKRQKSTDTLVQQVERVLSWLYCESYWIRRTFDASQEASLVAPICACLSLLTSLDHELGECVFFSSTVTQLTFRLFTMQFPYPGNRQRVSVVLNMIQEGCDPMDVVASYMRHDRGKEVI